MEVAIAHMSLAHTFGNVTAFVTEYVKNLFPPNYFNTVNISSTIAYRYFDIFNNTNKEFLKKRKPMLIVRPRFVMDDDKFLDGTFLTSRITDNYMDLDYGNLQPFFGDKDKGMEIRFLMNRVKMVFDITIVLEQQMEQINQYFYLRNRVRHEHPFSIKTFLESNIHKNLIDAIATEVGIDPCETKDVLDYFNKHSNYPLTYKMKNSTGNDEYFRYYPAVLDTTITGLQMDDGNKRGFVSEAFNINFSVSTEFTTSGLYYFFTEKKPVIGRIDMDIQNDTAIIPIFTLSDIYNLVEPPAGWNMYFTSAFKVSVDRGSDSLDLGEGVFNESIKTVIKYYVSKGISLDSLLTMFVFKDNDRLENNVDFSFDPETYNLIINKTNMLSTYRLIIYINTLHINNTISDIYKIDEET